MTEMTCADPDPGSAWASQPCEIENAYMDDSDADIADATAADQELTTAASFVLHVKASAGREERLRAEVRRLTSEMAELTRRYVSIKQDLATSEQARTNLTDDAELAATQAAGIEILTRDNSSLLEQVATLTTELAHAQRTARRAKKRELALARELAAMTVLANDLKKSEAARGQQK